MTGLDKFLYAFHRTATSVWYLVLVALIVLVYFGSGIYATWSEKRTERAYRAEYTALKEQLAECKTGHHCIVAGREFVTITAKGAH